MRSEAIVVWKTFKRKISLKSESVERKCTFKEETNRRVERTYFQVKTNQENETEIERRSGWEQGEGVCEKKWENS